MIKKLITFNYVSASFHWLRWFDCC